MFEWKNILVSTAIGGVAAIVVAIGQAVRGVVTASLASTGSSTGAS
jgi:hypothetical protein